MRRLALGLPSPSMDDLAELIPESAMGNFGVRGGLILDRIEGSAVVMADVGVSVAFRPGIRTGMLNERV